MNKETIFSESEGDLFFNISFLAFLLYSFFLETFPLCKNKNNNNNKNKQEDPTLIWNTFT